MSNRDEKIQQIQQKMIDDINDQELDELYNNLVINNTTKSDQIKQENVNNKTTSSPSEHSDNHTEKTKCDIIKISKNEQKYIIILKFINAILTVLGKNNINDITGFKNIRRDELLKPECRAVLDQHLDNIVAVFGKTNILYDKRFKIKLYTLTVIKRTSKLCGYTLKSTQKQGYKRNKCDGQYVLIYWNVYSVI